MTVHNYYIELSFKVCPQATGFFKVWGLRPMQQASRPRKGRRRHAKEIINVVARQLVPPSTSQMIVDT